MRVHDSTGAAPGSPVTRPAPAANDSAPQPTLQQAIDSLQQAIDAIDSIDSGAQSDPQARHDHAERSASVLDPLRNPQSRAAGAGQQRSTPAVMAGAAHGAGMACTPQDLVGAMLGAQEIRLQCGPPIRPAGSWLRPGLVFVGAQLGEREVACRVAIGRRIALAVWALAFLMLNAVLTLWLIHAGIVAAAATPRADAQAASGTWPPAEPEVAVQWSVTQVGDGYVLVALQAAATASRTASPQPGSLRAEDRTPPTTVTLPVGARLPNGEVLQATLPSRRSYITSSGALTTLLHAAAQPAAHEAAAFSDRQTNQLR